MQQVCTVSHVRVVPYLYLKQAVMPTPYHLASFMAEPHHRYQQQPPDVFKSVLPEKPPSTSILAVITILPLGGFFLLIAGLTLTGTLIGLAVLTPLFVIFSPVLIPAALTIGLAVTGWIASGAFGITALSAFAWMVNYLRQTWLPEKLEHAERGAQETADSSAQKVKETGHEAGDRD